MFSESSQAFLICELNKYARVRENTQVSSLNTASGRALVFCEMYRIFNFSYI